MIMLRSTHSTAMLKLAQYADEREERLLIGFEKERELYRSQIEDLKRLVFPPTPQSSSVVMEADNVISASEKPFELSEEEHRRIFADAREVDLLISGNYAEDLL